MCRTFFLKPCVFIGHLSLSVTVLVSSAHLCDLDGCSDTLDVSHYTVFLGLHALVVLQFVLCFQADKRVRHVALWWHNPTGFFAYDFFSSSAFALLDFWQPHTQTETPSGGDLGLESLLVKHAYSISLNVHLIARSQKLWMRLKCD